MCLTCCCDDPPYNVSGNMDSQTTTHDSFNQVSIFLLQFYFWCIFTIDFCLQTSGTVTSFPSNGTSTIVSAQPSYGGVSTQVDSAPSFGISDNAIVESTPSFNAGGMDSNVQATPGWGSSRGIGSTVESSPSFAQSASATVTTYDSSMGAEVHLDN